MIRIVLDTEQSKQISGAREAVEICDTDGRILGVLPPKLSPAEEECAANAKRALASDQPRYTSEQVFDHLDKLAGK